MLYRHDPPGEVFSSLTITESDNTIGKSHNGHTPSMMALTSLASGKQALKFSLRGERNYRKYKQLQMDRTIECLDMIVNHVSQIGTSSVVGHFKSALHFVHACRSCSML